MFFCFIPNGHSIPVPLPNPNSASKYPPLYSYSPARYTIQPLQALPIDSCFHASSLFPTPGLRVRRYDRSFIDRQQREHQPVPIQRRRFLRLVPRQRWWWLRMGCCWRLRYQMLCRLRLRLLMGRCYLLVSI